jgi:hypothetical protein
MAELDLLLAPGTLGRRTVIAAARAGTHHKVTWLIGDDGERIAAIVPPEVARAWLTARTDLEEAQEMAARLGQMARAFRGETGGT